MKQGSTDDPFAEEPQDGDAEDEQDEPDAESDVSDSAVSDSGRADRDSEVAAPTTGSIDPSTSGADSGSESAEREATEADSDASTDSEESGDATPERQSLPYIHARNGVKDGRTQRPVFLRDHVEAGIDDLVAEMEAELDEDVYKTDVTEAAMAVAQENPELVLAKLEEWGYGWS